MALKKYILQFGYGRWSKVRFTSKKSEGLLKHKSDREMRPYANWFLYIVYQTALKQTSPALQKDEVKQLEDILARIIKVRPGSETRFEIVWGLD